ncbi:hypothetical protein PPL_10964 [Heterostelium album PN500]|uniref:Thioredoxin domain-containing protein n=1 Tax=Heterostelium pallidum (strain ATCC 26659 / Pp 5 / PN500) TaxID=670386 RepID=D3BSJ5_HETP5|nr:hypothetical protein PPL_10964 [Heterostelium album PN500]EFA75460.1 hypothetical protein PPL_10964 [Heterostelium album PN500]|eukprot:XP_020427594.1 hypothetical protein PPL_10964 [Heterostelium album PN500]
MSLRQFVFILVIGYFLSIYNVYRKQQLQRDIRLEEIVDHSIINSNNNNKNNINNINNNNDQFSFEDPITFNITLNNFSEALSNYQIVIVQDSRAVRTNESNVDFEKLNQLLAGQNLSDRVAFTRLKCIGYEYPCKAMHYYSYVSMFVRYDPAEHTTDSHHRLLMEYNPNLKKGEIPTTHFVRDIFREINIEYLMERIHFELSPRITVLNTIDEYNRLINNVKYSIIGVFSNKDNHHYQWFDNITKSIASTKFTVIFTDNSNNIGNIDSSNSDNKLLHYLNIDNFKDDDSYILVVNSDIEYNHHIFKQYQVNNYNDLESFIRSFSIKPMINDYTDLGHDLVTLNRYRPNDSNYNNNAFPIIFIFCEDNQYESFKQQLLPIALNYSGQVSTIVSQQNSKYPNALFIDKQNIRYNYNYSSNSNKSSNDSSAIKIDIESFEQWINQCLNSTSKLYRRMYDIENDTIDSFMSDHKVTLLLFYYHWDGHSKKLQRTSLVEIVSELNDDMNIAIGRVDCEKNKQLCEHFNVTGTPTIYTHSNQTYQLSRCINRSKAALYYYIYHTLDPIMRNEQQLFRYLKDINNFVVAFVGPSGYDSELYKLMSSDKYSKYGYLHTYIFYVFNNEELVSKFSSLANGSPNVVGFINGKSPVDFNSRYGDININNNNNSSKLSKFVKIYATEPPDYIQSIDNIDRELCNEMPCLILIEDNHCFAFIESLATQLQGEVQVYYLSHYGKQHSFGVDCSNILVLFYNGSTYRPFSVDINCDQRSIDSTAILQWIKHSIDNQTFLKIKDRINQRD